MIQSDPTIRRKTIKTPNASASTLLTLSGPVVMCRKKTQVHADLSDREHHKRNRNAGVPNQRCPGDEERHRGEQDRKAQADKIALNAFRNLVAPRGLVARRVVGAV